MIQTNLCGSKKYYFLRTDYSDSICFFFPPYLVAAPKDGQGYVEVVLGGLTAIMLLLLLEFVVILVLSRRQKLQGSPTILRNPFGVTINMKVLLSLYP
jgi:hypothetical protein